MTKWGSFQGIVAYMKGQDLKPFARYAREGILYIRRYLTSVWHENGHVQTMTVKEGGVFRSFARKSYPKSKFVFGERAPSISPDRRKHCTCRKRGTSPRSMRDICCHVQRGRRHQVYRILRQAR